jgi:hypothetical protein
MRQGLNVGSRLAVASIFLLAPLAGGTLAAPPKKPPAVVVTPAERCDSLERQFDKALPKHEDAKALTAAKKLRVQGEKLCDRGKHAAGALALAQALADLGVDIVDGN